MAIVLTLIWVFVVLTLAFFQSHLFEFDERYSSPGIYISCDSNNVVDFKPDSLPFEDTEGKYFVNTKKFVEWFYNNYANCENGKYIRMEHNISVDTSACKPLRSKRYLDLRREMTDFAPTLIMENDICHKNKESCGLFNTSSFQPFNKNNRIDFGDILACDLPNTSGRKIVHYMMGFNSSNLVIEGTGNIDSEHPSNKMVVQFAKLNQKDNIFSKCFYLPLKDKSDENIAKIESRLRFTLTSQDNNKTWQYSVDTCKSQNLVLYWVYGVENPVCGGCTTDMECSDFKFIEATYSCDDVRQKVFGCLMYKISGELFRNTYYPFKM